MAEITKLSVEKALNKLRQADMQPPASTRHQEKLEELDQEIRRMRAQRLRLDRDQRGSGKHK